MEDYRPLIEKYYAAFSERDFPLMKKFLHDDFDFSGPLAVATSSDEYITQLAIFGKMKYKSTILNSVQEADQIVVRFEWKVTSPMCKPVPMTEWFIIEDSKIKKAELFFDIQNFEGVLNLIPVTN